MPGHIPASWTEKHSRMPTPGLSVSVTPGLSLSGQYPEICGAGQRRLARCREQQRGAKGARQTQSPIPHPQHLHHSGIAPTARGCSPTAQPPLRDRISVSPGTVFPVGLTQPPDSLLAHCSEHHAVLLLSHHRRVILIPAGGCSPKAQF